MFTLSVSLSKLFSAAADSRSSFFSSSGTSISGGSDIEDADLPIAFICARTHPGHLPIIKLQKSKIGFRSNV